MAEPKVTKSEPDQSVANAPELTAVEPPADQKSQPIPNAAPAPGPSEAQSTPAPPMPAEAQAPPQSSEDVNVGPLDERMAALLQPTARPAEPVTAGVAGGTGNDFNKGFYENDQEFVSRVANELDNSPAKTKELQQYIDRLRRGL